MRKGLPFVLLAVVIAALVAPVGSAVSLRSAPERHLQGTAWAIVAYASPVQLQVPGRGSEPSPPWLPEWGRLLVAGVVLIGLAGVARRGR